MTYLSVTKTIDRKCAQCGKTFQHSVEGRGRPPATCSLHCKADRKAEQIRARAESILLTKCGVEGCVKPLRSAGSRWCEMHYGRVRISGSPGEASDRMGVKGERTSQWCGDSVSYRGLHSRLTNDRGRASDFSCVDCGTNAHHWSYDHTDPNAIWGFDSAGNFLIYSVDLNRYEPRCASCHRLFDKENERGLVNIKP